MGVAEQNFEGISTNIPGVYVKSEFPPSLGSVGASSNVVTILGEAKGGVPYNETTLPDEQRVNYLSGVAQAIDILRGGNGLYMTEIFMRPTRDPQLNKPSQCQFIRVNPGTRASGNLKDIAPANIIDLKSLRYGALANQISRKVEAGTLTGTYKATVKFQSNTVVEKDNISLEYMDIQYVGAGSAAVMSITATTLTTTVTGAAGDNLSITLADFKDLDALISYIDNQAAYTAVLKGRNDAKNETFDAVTGVDIRTTVYTAKANVEALIQFFTNETGGELFAALTTGAVRNAITYDSTFIFMTGGSDSAASNSDWAAAFTLLTKLPTNHVLIATGAPAIQAMLASHLEEMSSIEQRQNRSGGTGASLSTITESARITEMKALNSARVEYWTTPFKRPDVLNGNQSKEFDPFYGAALGAGIRFGNAITISSTGKTVDVLSVSENYDLTAKKKYIGSGGILLVRDNNGIVVLRNITTYQGANLILNEPSMLRTADFISLDIQAKLKLRMFSLTEAPTALQIAEIQNYIITNLLPGYVRQNLLTKDPNTGAPAFSDVQFSITGDRFDLSYTGIIPAPMNFGFVKQKFIIVGFSG